MKDGRACVLLAELGQAWASAHSRLSVWKKRSTLPFQRGGESTGAIGVAVVAHHGLRCGEAERREVFDRPPYEAGCGLSALVEMLLHVGVARTIINARVQEGVAEFGTVSAAVSRATQHLVARPGKACQSGRVDVKQRTRARPLIAAAALPGRWWSP